MEPFSFTGEVVGVFVPRFRAPLPDDVHDLDAS
jgi:hypothetical protein